MNEDQTIQEALNILERRMSAKGEVVANTKTAANFLTLKLAESEREVFAILLLDTQNQLIEYKELFFGTVDQASVYPREVVKASLNANASAMIIAHNHPSGIADPSDADIRLTRKLREILNIVDVRLLDHIIVGGIQTTSFADRGLL